MDDLKEYSLVQPDFRDNDPRQLARLYPDSITNNKQNFISFVKKQQKFLFNHSLDVAEQAANLFGYILVPTSCLHWRRATSIAERRIFVGRNSFYMLKPDEINMKEKKRLMLKIEEMRYSK